MSCESRWPTLPPRLPLLLVLPAPLPLDDEAALESLALLILVLLLLLLPAPRICSESRPDTSNIDIWGTRNKLRIAVSSNAKCAAALQTLGLCVGPHPLDSLTKRKPQRCAAFGTRGEKSGQCGGTDARHLTRPLFPCFTLRLTLRLRMAVVVVVGDE